MYKMVKRGIDIGLAVAGLVPLMVIFPVVAAVIKLDSRGPIFFRARRVSRGKEIVIYKFRTMRDGAEREKERLQDLNERKNSPFFKIERDPRVTRAGRFLRKFWIDEWPQVVNVLKGDISMVGPRPYEPGEVAQYPEDYKFLAQEQAGITGLAQVNGSWKLTFEQVLAYDKYYARNKSLLLDLKILARTVGIMFTPSGV